ncbi:hypothetical protein BKA81DRAFT_354475 [Phyllosticta paracitricarpa]
MAFILCSGIARWPCLLRRWSGCWSSSAARQLDVPWTQPPIRVDSTVNKALFLNAIDFFQISGTAARRLVADSLTFFPIAVHRVVQVTVPRAGTRKTKVHSSERKVDYSCERVTTLAQRPRNIFLLALPRSTSCAAISGVASVETNRWTNRQTDGRTDGRTVVEMGSAGGHGG